MKAHINIDFEIGEFGCIVPTSHKVNADGYFRTRDVRLPLGSRRPLVMAHRLVWETYRGEIPEGYEIDHMCHNRACCNVAHLRCVPIVAHKVHHNSTRYAQRHQAAKEYWQENKPAGVVLAALFNVNPSTACDWIRQWKKEIS